MIKTKYDFNFPEEVIDFDAKRIINQIWKLIPMRENDENWIFHLDILIEEISGLGIILNKESDFLILLSKLEGLRTVDEENFMLYRKTVFRCIDLFSKVIKNDK